MHYIDGTLALEGDIVCGRGYNIPYDIVGPVTKLLPHMGDTCNIRVETRIAKWHLYDPGDDGTPGTPAHFTYETFEEAGETRRFRLIQRRGWTHTPLYARNSEIYGYTWLKDDEFLYEACKPSTISNTP
jgi:hypothetical protein